MNEVIDLSSDESTSSKVSSHLSNDVEEVKRKRNEKAVEDIDSSPSKIKKEDAIAHIDEETVNETNRVVSYTATNYQSTIKKKSPLEDDDAVLTIVTERVVVSSPRRGPLVIKKKVPLEDDDLVLLTNPCMCSPLQSAMKGAVERDRQDINAANQPPWWYNLATDVGDDIISKLRSK